MPCRCLFVLLFAASWTAVDAAPDKTLEDRVKRLEDALKEERAARKKLETALEKTTDSLARSHDQRMLEGQIEAYLDAHGAEALPEAAGSRLQIGGVIVGSYRFTDLDRGGPRTNTFQVEERYLRFVYRFSDRVTARYYTDGSLAEIEYAHADWLRVNFGQIIVPFGQFNPRSFPDTFDTLSRPLLYLGDEDTFSSPANNPRSVFRSIYTDTGFVVSGNLSRDEDQLYYAVFITNGLLGTSDLAQGSGFADNNDNKQVGARLAYTAVSWSDRARFGFGISWMSGKYDAADRLSYRMYGADFLVVINGLFRDAGGSLTLRAEYVFAPRETLHPTVGDPTAFLNDANRTQGAYLIAEARLDQRWMAYIALDWLQQSAPLLAGGLIDPASDEEATNRIIRYALGIVHRFELGFVFKFEYAFWDFDAGASDANRLSIQIVVPF